MNQASPEPKKGLSPLAIVLIVVGVLFVGGLGTCAIAGVVLGQKVGDIKRNIADGGLIMAPPQAVTTALGDDKKDYVGNWTSKSGHSTLKIEETGMLEYDRNETTNKSKLTGPIAEFQGNDIVMKLGIEFRIKVTTPPHVLHMPEKMEMVADGITFTRDLTAPATPSAAPSASAAPSSSK